MKASFPGALFLHTVDKISVNYEFSLSNDVFIGSKGYNQCYGGSDLGENIVLILEQLQRLT